MAAVLRVALTGGIATGKSHCLRRFQANGVPTIDADMLARAAVRPRTDGLTAIVRRFGPGVIKGDGTLDRETLGRIVFGDAAARRDLEQIIHPAVYSAIQDWLAALEEDETRPALAIADVPLLYETGHQGDFDRVVVAACPPDQQLARLMARDHLSHDEAAARIAVQIPIARKRALANHVIDTSGTPHDTDRRVDEVMAALRGDVSPSER